MSSPIIQAAISACILTATSNILAQCITAYRNDLPYSINWQPVLQFILYTLLNSPPNFLWQQFLESKFPSRTLRPSHPAILAASLADSTNDDSALDLQEKSHTLLESKLSIPNTIIKFLLDQSIGASANTVAFSLVMAAFHGADWLLALQVARDEFWPLMIAGFKLWPVVCLLNFTLVRSVQMRSLVGSLAGVGWNIYLSLFNSSR